MHDCPCCSEAVYTDDPSDLCSCCVEAGCEPHDCGAHGGPSHDVDGVYTDCQIPTCPSCETRATFEIESLRKALNRFNALDQRWASAEELASEGERR